MKVTACGIAMNTNAAQKKRFKSNINLWTLQATLKWSKKTINKYKIDKTIMNQLISRFTKLTGFEKNKIIPVIQRSFYLFQIAYLKQIK